MNEPVGHSQIHLARYGFTAEEAAEKFGRQYRLQAVDGVLWAPARSAKQAESDIKLAAEIAGTGEYAPERIAARKADRAQREAEAVAAAAAEKVAAEEAEKVARTRTLADAKAAQGAPATARQIAYIAKLIRQGAHEEGGYVGGIGDDIDLSTLTKTEASRMIDSMTGRY